MNRLYRSIGICCTIPAALHYHKRRSFALLAKTEQKTDIRPYIEWSEKDHSDFLAECDCLFELGQIQELINNLENHLESKDPDIQWRMSRALRELSNREKNLKVKQKLLEDALKIAELSLDLKHNNWAAHKWIGIILGDLKGLQGTKALLEASPQIKTHFEKSIKIHPDPTTIYCLGVWHYKFSDLPWYQRQAAEIIFAKVPESDFETALSYFLQAEKIQPGFYSKNQLMIGKCYMKMNEKDKAKIFFEKVKDWNDVIMDQDAYEEACALLKKI